MGKMNPSRLHPSSNNSELQLLFYISCFHWERGTPRNPLIPSSEGKEAALPSTPPFLGQWLACRKDEENRGSDKFSF